MKVEDIKRENFINLYNDKGEKHGHWEVYYDNGQLCSKGDWVNGNKHGYWERYYADGQLSYKGYYVNSEQHGYWETYCDNGQLYSKCYYDMGKQVDYNPDEPKIIELTLSDIAVKFNIPVEQLRIKK